MKISAQINSYRITTHLLKTANFGSILEPGIPILVECQKIPKQQIEAKALHVLILFGKERVRNA